LGVIILKNIYFGKTVLITGHSGFKGSWLTLWLSNLGAKVVGVSIDIPSQPSNYNASFIKNEVEDYFFDIRDLNSLKKLINKIKPNFIFHLAAQALVKSAYENPIDTFSTNALGSINVLEAIRTLNQKVVVIMITSDKVYDNKEWEWGYRETDQIGGKDPYSASKGMAEIAIRSYIESFYNQNDKIRIGIVRAGNVIGGGDWAKNRIVPDCISAWSLGKVVDIRSPHSTRPWQHVLEPLSGYLTLAANLSCNYINHGKAYNFGPVMFQNYPVKDLINEMSKYWNKVKWRDVSLDEMHIHEAGLLKLNCDKAMFDLDWQPTLNFEETIKMTVEWYKFFYNDDEVSMYGFSISQINDYVNLAKLKNLEWAADD
jgi:CDP-glucose 4,6-dehydratase